MKVIQNKLTKSLTGRVMAFQGDPRTNRIRGKEKPAGPALLILGAAVVSLLHINLVHAESDSGSLTITAEKSLTVTVPGTTNLNVHPTENGAFNTADINIIVNSNNRYGYNLNMTTATTSLTGNAPLSSGNYPVIESISGSGMTCTVETGTTCNFTKDKWGYKLSTDTIYSPIQANTNMLIKNNTNESTGTPETSTVTFGARLSNATPAGSYSATLTFIATINNPTAVGGVSFEEAFDFADKQKYNGYYAMQDIDATICSYVRTSEQADYNDTEEIQLIDKRDNKLYWVAKLLDNNCWMTQNLDFDITGNTLSSTTTNLVAYGSEPYTSDKGYSQDSATGEITWTPMSTGTTIITGRDKTNPTNGDINYGANAGKWANNNNNPYSVDPGEWYQSGTYFASSVCNDVDWSAGCNFLNSAKNTAQDGVTALTTYFRQTPYENNGTHGAIGNWYNWNAAVAANDTSAITSGTLTNSVCPAGWGLPANGKYGAINTNYNSNAVSGALDDGLFSAPLYLVRGGFIWTGDTATLLDDAGRGGNYWSGTTYSADSSYRLYFSSSLVNPAYGNYRGRGFSVRCLLK